MGALRTRLRTAIDGALTRYRPLAFGAGTQNEQPLTLQEFEELCNWESMRRLGIVGEGESPLGIAGLRTSRLFPRHLLYRGEHERTVLLTPVQARGVVAAALLRRVKLNHAQAASPEEGFDDLRRLVEAQLEVTQHQRT